MTAPDHLCAICEQPERTGRSMPIGAACLACGAAVEVCQLCADVNAHAGTPPIITQQSALARHERTCTGRRAR